jgi:hypothetical protein
MITLLVDVCFRAISLQLQRNQRRVVEKRNVRLAKSGHRLEAGALVLFKHCTFHGGSSKEPLLIRDLELGRGARVSFHNCELDSLGFRGVRMAEDAAVEFTNCTIAGQLLFDDAQPRYFASYPGNTRANLSLYNTPILGGFSLRHCTFANRVQLFRCNGISQRSEIFACRFEGDFVVDRSRLDGHFVIKESDFLERTSFHECAIGASFEIEHSVLERRLTFSGSEFEGAPVRIDLGKHNEISFSGCRSRSTSFAINCNLSKVRFAESVFQSIYFEPQSHRTWPKRRSGVLWRPYHCLGDDKIRGKNRAEEEELARTYRMVTIASSGPVPENIMSDLRVAELECERRQKPRLKKPFLALLGFFSRYGEGPLRVLAWSVAFVILFAVGFRCCDVFSSATNPWSYLVSAKLGFIEWIPYSLSNFATLGSGDVKPPQNLSCQAILLVSSEPVVGAALIALLMATIVRKLSRAP